MGSEFKRTMKLMWGEGGRFHRVFGCSVWKVLMVLLFAVLSEGLFWEGRDIWEFKQGRSYRDWSDGYSSFDLGIYPCLLFAFMAMYDSGRGILTGLGKWLRTSKLAKSVVIKGTIVNRLMFFGIVFVPCLVSRICLICLGYRGYVRIELFLVAWGGAYVLSVLGSFSMITLIAGFVFFIASILVDDFWKFTSGFAMPTIGAVLVFLVCFIGGILLEWQLLERVYKKRNSRNNSFWQKELGGNK